MAEFLLVSLNCHTFVKISFLNSLKTIPVYLHNPFSARILADTLRKNQLSNQLSFGGKQMLKAYLISVTKTIIDKQKINMFKTNYININRRHRKRYFISLGKNSF